MSKLLSDAQCFSLFRLPNLLKILKMREKKGKEKQTKKKRRKKGRWCERCRRSAEPISPLSKEKRKAFTEAWSSMYTSDCFGRGFRREERPDKLTTI